MKRQGGYPYTSNEDKTCFWFTSVGQHGEIKKKVEFERINSGWNLAFGDVTTDDELSDAVISDNGDMRKVLQTVANIVHDFSNRYPSRIIFIKPYDDGRRLLYNRLFKEKLVEILLVFELKGFLFGQGILEIFQPGKLYDAFVLARKKDTFDQ